MEAATHEEGTPASIPATPVDPATEREHSDAPALHQLLRRLATDGRILLRQEVALARLELTESARLLARQSALVAAGIFLIAVGLVILVVFLILALGRILWGHYWLSTLLVGSALVIGGLLLLRRGRKGIQSGQLRPQRTIDSLKDAKQLVESSADRVRPRANS